MKGARRHRRGLTIFFAGFAGVVLLTLLFLGPGSFRVWSAQRAETSELDARIEALERANERLEARAAELRDPEAIKELARRDYGMVPKGSKAFAILPSPEVDKRPSGTWPFVHLEAEPDPAGEPGD